jgi:hypothetical protein
MIDLKVHSPRPYSCGRKLGLRFIHVTYVIFRGRSRGFKPSWHVLFISHIPPATCSDQHPVAGAKRRPQFIFWPFEVAVTNDSDPLLSLYSLMQYFIFSESINL